MPRRFTMRGDRPPELLDKNTRSTAIKTLLAALGARMTDTFAAQATACGVKLRRLEVDVAVDMDLNGLFGLKPVSPAVSAVKLVFHVAADATPGMPSETLETEITVAHLQRRYPPVTVEAGFADSGR